MTESRQMSTSTKYPTGDYHYTECGLDNVFLVNGFRYEDGPRGPQVIIEDIDGLHRAIGNILVNHCKNLSGKDIKFLRQEMSMSQTTLARLVGVSERAVIRWEKAKAGQVPSVAEAAVRMLCRDFSEEGGTASGKKAQNAQDNRQHGE